MLKLPGIIMGPGRGGPIRGMGCPMGPPMGTAGIMPGGPGIGPGTGALPPPEPALNAAAVGESIQVMNTDIIICLW